MSGLLVVRDRVIEGDRFKAVVAMQRGVPQRGYVRLGGTAQHRDGGSVSRDRRRLK